MVQGRITEADTPTIPMGSTPTGLMCDPPPSSTHFYVGCPSCHNPPTFSWLGRGIKYTGLHTQWRGFRFHLENGSETVCVWETDAADTPPAASSLDSASAQSAALAAEETSLVTSQAWDGASGDHAWLERQTSCPLHRQSPHHSSLTPAAPNLPPEIQQLTVIIMVALWNRAYHYIFILWFLLSIYLFFLA